MLLCAPGLYPAKQAEPRAAKPYLYFVRSFPTLRQGSLMPPAPTQAIMFCLFSAEAVLLTGKRLKSKNVILRNEELSLERSEKSIHKLC